jgi:hypothetical protein
MCMISIPTIVIVADQNSLNPNIALIMRLTARHIFENPTMKRGMINRHTTLPNHFLDIIHPTKTVGRSYTRQQPTKNL